MRTINSFPFVALLFSLTFCPSLAGGREMRVGAIVEETTKDTDVALVVPDRLGLICRSGPGTPWGFSFAGFETSWSRDAGPIELEVSGSGGYAPHDLFSIAGLSGGFGRRADRGGGGGGGGGPLVGPGV